VNEKSCGAYPKEWAEFVVFMLDELCRASECKKDQATNPSPPHNKHTIHWIEMKMEDMRDIIEKGGKLKFGIGFSLSTWKLRDLNKYYHKHPGRNVCLCRYHMDWDHRFDALRRWKPQVKKELNLRTVQIVHQYPHLKRSENSFAALERQTAMHVQKVRGAAMSKAAINITNLLACLGRALLVSKILRNWFVNDDVMPCRQSATNTGLMASINVRMGERRKPGTFRLQTAQFKTSCLA
jgi:hypothetical protein